MIKRSNAQTLKRWNVGLILLAVGCTMWAQKPAPSGGRFYFDEYLKDTGSALAGDVVRVAAERTTPLVPLTAAVLVHARPVGSSDAGAWEELLPRRTLAELPAEYALANATNHDVMVTLDWTPGPGEETNGVWRAEARVVLREEAVSNGVFRLVVPRATILGRR